MPHLLQVSSHGRGNSKVNFATEIQAMMYALGDCRRPLKESAQLVETAVHQKMLSVLNKAAQICISRGGRFIGIEDFLYLMRLDRVRLKRLLRFLSFKDNKILKTLSDEEDPETAFGVDLKPSNTSKRQRIAYEFLSMIDQTGEFVSLFEDEGGVDQVKQERLERIEDMTKNMDSSTYQDFSESRQVNFYKKIVKFKEWVVYSELEPKPNSSAIEVLAYLAYETVAEIVDLSLYVRRDMNSAFLGPTDKLSAPKFVNSGVYTGQLLNIKTNLKKTDHSTPPVSPSTSLVSPSITSSNNFSTFPTIQSQTEFTQPSDVKAVSTIGKTKAKKRKKTSGTSTYDIAAANALQPRHVREAIRRFCNGSAQFGL